MPCATPPTGDSDPQEEHRERARRTAARYRAARDNRPAPLEPAAPGPGPREKHQVRLTPQRLLTTHVQPTAEHHWAGISLDLTGATLTDFTLTRSATSRWTWPRGGSPTPSRRMRRP